LTKLIPDADNAAVGSRNKDFLQEAFQKGCLLFLFLQLKENAGELVLQAERK
jgi:hypothetical protein